VTVETIPHFTIDDGLWMILYIAIDNCQWMNPHIAIDDGLWMISYETTLLHGTIRHQVPLMFKGSN
jgi:hypothetical protein